MFPSLLLTHPDVAHSLVAFRGRTLAAAQANAQANGYRGAMYPWEADERATKPLPTSRCRMRAPRSTSPETSRWRSGSTISPPETPPGWREKGFPVIRETADFWVSRAMYDSTAERYHIKNVVSVAEGLIGVTDDAYTNAVARKNLEIAVTASKRLGRPADPRWSLARRQAAPAIRLGEPVLSHLRGRARLHAGLGHAAPELSARGADERTRPSGPSCEQAVAQLLKEGPGAMMGSTLLSVDAAELGDRALVDSLLPHSYRGHLKGPFLMLSETPTNDAVNFVTGAGGFLQQVIYGYTGLRLGEQGLEPAFPPVLPSQINRLVLRNMQSRGKRYDVIVDSIGPADPARSRHGPAMTSGALALSLLLGAARGPASCDPTRPADAPGARFPRARPGRHGRLPGLPDPLLSRLQRQHGPDLPRASGRPGGPAVGRCGERERRVHRARCRRAARPARPGRPRRRRSPTRARRGRIEYRLTAESPGIELGWFLLGTMRVERDFQYASAICSHSPPHRSGWRRNRCWWRRGPATGRGARAASGAPRRDSVEMLRSPARADVDVCRSDSALDVRASSGPRSMAATT